MSGDSAPAASAPSVSPEPTDTIDALRHEAARLRALLRERDDVLAIAAHELRNPLHELTLRLALVRTLTQGLPDIAAHVAKAQVSLASYSQRATLLLELVRSGQGADYPLTVRPTDLVPVLAAVAERLHVEAEARGIALHTELPTACVVETDPVVVAQVVDNLLLNAFKHALCARVRLVLRATATQACVAVVDDGRGIPAEVQERVFHKFATADNLLHEDSTGLGLWIVRRLAAALGGTISLHSAPGRGTRFDLCIPMAAASTDALNAAAESPP